MPIRTSGEKMRRKAGKFLFEFMNSSELSFNVLFSAREGQIVERYENLSLFYKQFRKLALLVEDILWKFFFQILHAFENY